MHILVLELIAGVLIGLQYLFPQWAISPVERGLTKLARLSPSRFGRLFGLSFSFLIVVLILGLAALIAPMAAGVSIDLAFIPALTWVGMVMGAGLINLSRIVANHVTRIPMGSNSETFIRISMLLGILVACFVFSYSATYYLDFVLEKPEESAVLLAIISIPMGISFSVLIMLAAIISGASTAAAVSFLTSGGVARTGLVIFIIAKAIALGDKI